MYNKIIALGKLVTDVEVKSTPIGKKVGNFRFVTYEVKGDKEICAFFDVTVWKRTAENCQTYLKKGSKALIEGSFQTEEWEQEGKKRSRLKLIASRVQFLDSKPVENKEKLQKKESEELIHEGFDDVPF